MNTHCPSKVALLFCVALLGSCPSIAQSLESYDADISETGNGYHVSLLMRFKNAGDVRYSILESLGQSLAQAISGCDGENAHTDNAPFGERLFPAAQTKLQAGCSLVRLTYDVSPGARVPLLVPDVKLASNGVVRLSASGPGIRGRSLFPRLDWSSDGVGRHQMGHLPSVVIFDVPEPSSSSGRDARQGFGFAFYGFFMCAVAFLGVFFLWARRY